MSKFHVSLAIIALLMPSLSFDAEAAQPQAMPALPSASVYSTMAIIESRLEQHKVDDETGKAIEAVLQAAPNVAHAHWLAAKYYDLMGLEGLRDQEYEQADHLNPQQPEAVLDAFNSRYEHGQFGDAFQDYQYLQQRFPDDPMILLMQAQLYEGKGKQQDADWFIERAMEVAPIRTGVATAAAELRLRQKRPQEALKLAQQDLSKQPDSYRANAVAGHALMQLNRAQEGGNYLRKAFALKSDDRMYNNGFAISFLKAGMYEDALEPAMLYMAQCTQLNDMDRAKMRLIGILKHIPRDEAEHVADAADRVLKLAPWQSRLHLGLGDVYDGLGWTNLAEQHYLTGIKLNPAIGRAYLRVAMDLEKTGQLPLALVYYKKAFDKDPKDPQIQQGYTRAIERIVNHDNDLALQLHNWIHRN